MTKREELIQEALSWRGTPHRHMQKVKGAGVDCGQVFIEWFGNCGLIEKFDTGYYPSDFALNSHKDTFLQWIKMFCVETEDPEPGDIAMFKFGRVAAHGALVLPDNKLIHAYIGQGVIVSDINDAELKGRFHSYWKPVMEGY